MNPVVWRYPIHSARKLFGFSIAEHGSMLDLYAAARLTTCAARRAAYVRHALDERRHALMFALRSAELLHAAHKESMGFPNAEIEHLFENLGEIQFLAFVHHGEARGRRQFEAYRDWFIRKNDKASRALFEGIVRDERHHEQYTWDLLVELTGGTRAARKELRRAVLWEKWRTWRRAGRLIAQCTYFLCAVALYVALAPFFLLVRGTAARRPRWHLSEEPSGEWRDVTEESIFVGTLHRPSNSE